MSKKDALIALTGLFEKQRILDMNQLCKALNTTSRATAFRYLQELHHLTSYTHNGKYYTLPGIPQFDQEGFWYYGDIGFSLHGTLIDTLTHVITTSESGKTGSELEKYFRTRVQNSLQVLLKAEKIAKVKPVKRYLYVSPDPNISDRQIKKRTNLISRENCT
jgi:predicted transcriptional regulator